MDTQQRHALGHKLREARTNRGMVIDDVWLKLRETLPPDLAVSRTAVSNLELGKVQRPDPVTVTALCAIYDVDLSDVSDEMASVMGTVVKLAERTSSESGIRFLVGSPAMAA